MPGRHISRSYQHVFSSQGSRFSNSHFHSTGVMVSPIAIRGHFEPAQGMVCLSDEESREGSVPFSVGNPEENGVSCSFAQCRNSCCLFSQEPGKKESGMLLKSAHVEHSLEGLFRGLSNLWCHRHFKSSRSFEALPHRLQRTLSHIRAGNLI